MNSALVPLREGAQHKSLYCTPGCAAVEGEEAMAVRPELNGRPPSGKDYDGSQRAACSRLTFPASTYHLRRPESHRAPSCFLVSSFSA